MLVKQIEILYGVFSRGEFTKKRDWYAFGTRFNPSVSQYLSVKYFLNYTDHQGISNEMRVMSDEAAWLTCNVSAGMKKK